MCGRYHNRFEKQQIAEAFRAKIRPSVEIYPSYNVAPQTFQPIVYLDRENERELAMMRWGLVPFWSKDGKVSFSTINAKAETVATSPVYREAIKNRRCLVSASGFYEWMKLDPKTKQPYSITPRDGSIIAFAGLWERWKNKTTDEVLETYTIITTDPNELMKPEGGPPIHDRMPVILAPKDYERWLEPGPKERPPTDLLRPYPAEELAAWKVHKDVGNVRNNRPDLYEQMWERETR